MALAKMREPHLPKQRQWCTSNVEWREASGLARGKGDPLDVYLCDTRRSEIHRLTRARNYDSPYLKLENVLENKETKNMIEFDDVE